MSFQLGVTRSPSQILFGSGQRHALGRAAAAIGRRALVCTDARFSALPVLDGMLQDLRRNGVEVQVFDATQPELPLESVLQCADRHRDFAPDLLMGLGGGSCMDLAKLVALVLTHPGSIHDYYGELKIPSPVLPVIAIPTTSGTGSEVTPVAVLADPAREMKVGISSPYLIPHIAICDPELTVTCPPALTAISGADALAHAIEALSAISRPADPQIAFDRVFVGKNALSDRHALAAIGLIFEHLPSAVSDGENAGARSAMMLASTLAGLAFGSAGTSAAHAIQYPIGALTNTAHGLGVGVLLPFAMDYNLDSCTEDYASIAHAIGAGDRARDGRTNALTAIARVRALFSAIGIPENLADIGVKPDQIDWIAEKTLLAARLVDNNPRLLDRAGVKQILTCALGADARPAMSA